MDLNLELTGIWVYPKFDTHSNILAKVSLEFNHAIYVADIRVVSIPNGYKVEYPPNSDFDGKEVRSAFYIRNVKMRNDIEKLILKKYMEIE